MTDQTKSMRIRVNASRTAKGYSVDATAEVVGGVNGELESMGDLLEHVALVRLEGLMAKLNDQYPRVDVDA